MKHYYSVFETNLPIPVRVNLSSTNGYDNIKPLHNTKDIRIGAAYAKYGFPGKLSFMQILYCYKGEFNYITDVGEFKIKEGECFLVGRQRVRYCDIKEENRHLVYSLGIDHELCKKIGVDDSLTGPVKADDIVPKSCILDIIKEVDNKQIGWENRTVDVVKSLLGHINKTYKEYAVPVNDKNIFPDEIMKKIDSYLKTNITERITLDDMAGMVGFKSTQFNKRFKITTDYTPIEYLNLIRCRTARELILTTDFTIEDIIAMCGYNDRSYFYKKYREVYGENAYNDIKRGPVLDEIGVDII